MQKSSRYPKYINFNILDDLDASDINSARELSKSVKNDSKCTDISFFNNEEKSSYAFKIIIPLNDLIGLKTARTLCERIAYILDLSDEIIKYSTPEFFSGYPHFKKLGVSQLPGARSANCIAFFVIFRRESIRELDKLFKRLDKVSTGRNDTQYITVVDQKGDTGMYMSYVSQPYSQIQAIAYLLGMNSI